MCTSACMNTCRHIQMHACICNTCQAQEYMGMNGMYGADGDPQWIHACHATWARMVCMVRTEGRLFFLYDSRSRYVHASICTCIRMYSEIHSSADMHSKKSKHTLHACTVVCERACTHSLVEGCLPEAVRMPPGSRPDAFRKCVSVGSALSLHVCDCVRFCEIV